MAEAIQFVAEVAQVRTMADGGLRIVLDLPEDAIPQAAMLMECKRAGAVLQTTLIPLESKDWQP